MGRIRRGGYIFEFWIGDHPPRHVHIHMGHRLIAKVVIDGSLKVIQGQVGRRLRRILDALIMEGRLV